MKGSDILDFCRYPVPRAPIEIAKHIQGTRGYKTRPDVLFPLIKPELDELCASNFLVEYTPTDERWENTRKLLKGMYKKQKRPLPRKLVRLYQVNFFYLAGEEKGFYDLPVLKDVNFDLVTLFYPFIHDKKLENYLWNMLNLFLSYDTDERVRLALYKAHFSPEESDRLEKALKYKKELSQFFGKFPFKPDVEKAIEFLDYF